MLEDLARLLPHLVQLKFEPKMPSDFLAALTRFRLEIQVAKTVLLLQPEL